LIFSDIKLCERFVFKTINTVFSEIIIAVEWITLFIMLLYAHKRTVC